MQGLIEKLERQGLSPKTVRLAAGVLSQALRRAVRWGMLASNPAPMVELPKQTHREMRALSRDEVAEFRKAARADRYAVLFDFLLGTGCRPGEALALRWQDIDSDARTATIQKSLTTAGGKPTFSEPKTGRSRRKIPMPAALCARLTEHRRDQAARSLRLGAVYARELDLVFANEMGGPLDLRNIANRHLKPILAKAELPRSLRLYDLRHTHATLLLAEGVHPKIAAERLGHATTQMTLDVYSHVLPGMQEDATRRIDAILFG